MSHDLESYRFSSLKVFPQMHSKLCQAAYYGFLQMMLLVQIQ